MNRVLFACILAILSQNYAAVLAQTPETPNPELPDPSEIFYENVQWSIFEPEPPVIPETATSPPPTVCNGQVVQAEPDKEVWTIAYFDDEREEAFLCHSSTGEHRDVLYPGNISWQVFSSPNATWLILVARYWSEHRDFQVYSYQIDDRQMTRIGEIRRNLDNVVSICEWISETQGLLCTWDYYRYWPGGRFYAFDVEQADSIEYAFGGWPENIVRIENPVRYVSMFSQDHSASITGGRGAEDLPCALEIYDSAGVRRQELAYECIPIMLDDSFRAPFFQHGDVIYYLTIENRDSTISSLRNYNVETEFGNIPLFSGEIETILSVSPSGKYIVVLLADNGILDFPWRQSPCCFPTRVWRVVILDWENSHPIYRSEPIGVYTLSQVVWLDDTTVVISAISETEPIRVTEDEDVIHYVVPASLRRITFTDNGTHIAITTRYGTSELNVSPQSNNYWLLDNNTVIDLRTFEEVPILRENVTENYRVITTWMESGDLRVRIYTHDNLESAIYRVLLP